MIMRSSPSCGVLLPHLAVIYWTVFIFIYFSKIHKMTGIGDHHAGIWDCYKGIGDR